MRALPLLSMYIVPLLALAGGCTAPGQTPLQQAHAANLSLTLVADSLDTAHRSGFLPKDRARELVPYVDAANAAARKLSQAARQGATGPFSQFEAAKDALNAALDVLLAAQMEAEETAAAVKRVRQAERSPDVPETLEPVPIGSSP